jgi:hypothetical protein
MAKIYRRANRVIVLDAELLVVKGQPGHEEILTRILASHWIRRLWTLQEAVLPKIVYYQLAEHAIRVSRGPNWGDLTADWDNEVWKYADVDFGWNTLVRALPEGIWRFKHVFGALQFRCVSRIEDQPTCVAILLDMDLEELHRVPLVDRTRKLWSMFEMIPVGLLFLPGEKLEEVGFTWALKSFVACSSSPGPTLPAYPTGKGLELSLYGFVMKGRLDSPRSAVIAVELAGRVYYIRQNLLLRNKSWDDLKFTSMRQLAVILSLDPSVPGLEAAPAFDATMGALVEVCELTQDVIVAKYLRAVSIIAAGAQLDLYPRKPWSKTEIEEKKQVVQVERTKLLQKWMIK